MDNKNTIICFRVKGKRPDAFQDPPMFDWNDAKERQLWHDISSMSGSQTQLDWSVMEQKYQVSQAFLKKRSYSLLANKLQRLNDFIDESKVVDNERQIVGSLINEENFFLGSESDTKALHIREQVQDVANQDDETRQTHDKLESSKILSQKMPLAFKNNGEDSGFRESSDLDMSTSLSVSTSALEEALMDRLQI